MKVKAKLSARLEAVREDVLSRHGSFIEPNPYCADVALWRAWRDDRSFVQIRAARLLELAGVAPVEIRPHWRLVGEHMRHGQGWPLFGFARKERPPLELMRELGVDPDDFDDVRNAVHGWNRLGLRRHERLTVSVCVGAADEEANLGHGGWGEHGPTSVFIASGWMENHSVRDYAKLIRIGFGGLREEIGAQLAASDITDPDWPQRNNFWRAALHVCEAGILLGQRYSSEARRFAGEADTPAERERLEFIATTCERVPERGARTFAEAVQALWFGHVLTCGEDGINANSIGRMDQFLWPYYEADLANGTLTREQAREIMQELACKLYLDYDVQAITLGGVDSEGRDAVNDLSHVILDATDDVDLIRDLSARLHKDSPPDFVRHCCELVIRGGGIPFFFNDDCFVRALNDRGVPIKDARDYAPIGCIELTIPGKANPHAVSGWLNGLKCLELALFDGKDPATGTQLGPNTGELSSFKDFESFYAAYHAQIECFCKRIVYHCNRGELAQRERGPLPLWSVLTDDCIKRGRDITDGGAVYNFHEICFSGTANIADSLAAIRKLVFEEKSITADELLAALRANFEGDENVHKLLTNGAPKYGNDIEEVDELAARVAQGVIDVFDGMRSPLGGRYFVHLFSFKQNIPQGRAVGATPDGRLAGEPLAYSLSAHQGRDEAGVTAMLNSLAKLPHDQAAGATAAIVDLSPSFLKGAEGLGRLVHLITSAIAMGIGQLQWNVTSVERLRQAQEDPEHYGNIAVRVAGYSQLFKLIDRPLQEHIIARTKHAS